MIILAVVLGILWAWIIFRWSLDTFRWLRAKFRARKAKKRKAVFAKAGVIDAAERFKARRNAG